MPKQYRVRRDIPGNTYTQVKATDLPECKRVLRSIKQTWDDVKDLGFSDEEPFDVTLSGKVLEVTRDGLVVDRYVIEPA